VIYDVTHSLQLPGASAEGTGGAREFTEPLLSALLRVRIAVSARAELLLI